MLIKTPLLHQSFGPRVFLSFFLFLLSLSLFLANSLERRGPLEKAHCALTHLRGSLVPTCSASPKNRTLLTFHINRGISASFSLLLSYHRLRTTRFWSIKGPTFSNTNFVLVFRSHCIACVISLPRDQTCASSIGCMESYQLDDQGSP